MFTEITLWATILIFTIHLSGHIFDKITIIPNWNSGEIADMQRNKAFFRKGQIQIFFGPVILACFLSSLLAMIAVWGHGGATKTYAIAAFALSTAINIWTLAYFVPMNKYFDGQNYEAETLGHLVKRWTTANHLRFVLLTVALGLAIAAFEHYRG